MELFTFHAPDVLLEEIFWKAPSKSISPDTVEISISSAWTEETVISPDTVSVSILPACSPISATAPEVAVHVIFSASNFSMRIFAETASIWTSRRSGSQTPRNHNLQFFVGLSAKQTPLFLETDHQNAVTHSISQGIFFIQRSIGDLGKIYILSLIGNQCYFPACPTNIQLFYPLCRNMVVSRSIPQCCTRICFPRKILPSIQGNTTKWNSRQPTN